ncbi:MAG: response regulator transcription factor [Rhodospirillales bacterium]|nr:response regulator transcription factor [Rhodospirillales bacterium]
MIEMNFEKVRIVVGEPDSRISTGLRHALQSQGFRSIEITNSFSDIESALLTNSADLILTEVQLEDGDVFDLVRRLRNFEIGDNPFVVTMATADSPDKECINRVLDSGFDDLIIKPFSTGDLLKRFVRFARKRKPFVITRSYIGPDRRLVPRPGAGSAPLIDAPNPVFAKAHSDQPQNEFKKLVEATVDMIKALRIESMAEQVKWLVERIMPTCLDDAIGSDAINHLAELIEACATIASALAESPLASEAITFSTISDIAQKIQSSPSKPNVDHFDQLYAATNLIDEFVLGEKSAA